MLSVIIVVASVQWLKGKKPNKWLFSEEINTNWNRTLEAVTLKCTLSRNDPLPERVVPLPLRELLDLDA